MVPSVFHVSYNWPSSSPEACANSTGAAWGSEADGCVDQIRIRSNGWQFWGHLSLPCRELGRELGNVTSPWLGDMSSEAKVSQKPFLGHWNLSLLWVCPRSPKLAASYFLFGDFLKIKYSFVKKRNPIVSGTIRKLRWTLCPSSWTLFYHFRRGFYNSFSVFQTSLFRVASLPELGIIWELLYNRRSQTYDGSTYSVFNLMRLWK